MKRRFDCRVAAGLVAVATLWLGNAAHALYEPERLGDTSRRWALSARVTGEYDDNTETTETNPQASFRTAANFLGQVNLPAEQSFLRARYQYQVTYTEARTSDPIDQSHSVDVLASHTFSPRLVLNLNDSFRRGIEPELVDVQAGNQVELRRRGDYNFNDANLSLSYNLSRRWVATVRGSWEFWRYDLTLLTNTVTTGTNTVTTNIGPSISDRDIYQGSFEMLYALSPRTYTGVGYQLTVTDYVHPGSNDTRNSVSHTAYGALSHTFNPRLSAVLNVGAEMREFGDGTKDTAPYVSASANYTFARDAVATLGIQYAISATEVGAFRSTDVATIFGRGTYRFSPKLRASLDALYSLATYQNPLPGVFPPVGPIPDQETSYRFGATVNYDLNRWSNVFVFYNFDRTDSDVPGRSFERNRVGAGVNVGY